MSLDFDALRRVTTIVVHKNEGGPCPDGVASAILLSDALRAARVQFVSHGEELDRLEPWGGMLFCDIVPPRRRAAAFVEAGAFVLDHHRSARDVVAMFGERGVFADEETEPGVSGAVLAFREVWARIERPHERSRDSLMRAETFASLVGIRDTWQRHSPDWARACAVSEALAFWPLKSWRDYWPERPFDNGSALFQQRLSVGMVLLEKREARVRDLIARGETFTTRGGRRALVISTTETSDVAEAASGVDVVVGFAFRAGAMQLSLRSRSDFDAAAFAKAHGGGGHTKAAGCSVELDDGDPQPYVLVRSLLERWEKIAPYVRADA